MEYTDRFIPLRLPNAGKPLRALSHVTSSNRQKLLTPNSQVINFYNHYEPYYEFTNFYFQPIKIDDHTWPTTEHYFQAQKFVGTPYYHHIRKLPHPRDAFQVSREHAASRWVRGDWAVVKNDVMLKALREKFTQHDYLKKKLLETKDKVLVEHTVRDSYWGDGGDGKGLNMLGKLLMQVRDEIRCSDKHKENTTIRSAHLRRSSSLSNGLNCLKDLTTTRNGLDSQRSYCGDEVFKVRDEIRCSDKHKENTTTRSAHLRRSSSFSNGLNCLKGSTTTRNGLDSQRSYCGDEVFKVRDEIRCSDKHKENTTTKSASLRRSSSFSNGLNCLKSSTTTRNDLDSHRSYCDEVLSAKKNRRKDTFDQVSHIGTPLTNRKVFNMQPERQERKRSSSSTDIGQKFGTRSKTVTSITNDSERRFRPSLEIEGRLGTSGSDLESRSRPGRANQSSVPYNIISGQ